MTNRMSEEEQRALAQALQKAMARAFGSDAEKNMQMRLQNEAAKDRTQPEAEQMARIATDMAAKVIKEKDAGLQHLIILGMPFGDGTEAVGLASSVDCAMSLSMADVMMSELIPDMGKQFGFNLPYRLLIAWRILTMNPRTRRDKWTVRQNTAQFGK